MTTDPGPSEPDHEKIDPITLYQDGVADYLDVADWIEPADVITTIHLQQIARSLDAQLTKTGEVQSALASTFSKTIAALNARRPKPASAPSGVPGQTDVFDFMED